MSQNKLHLRCEVVSLLSARVASHPTRGTGSKTTVFDTGPAGSITDHVCYDQVIQNDGCGVVMGRGEAADGFRLAQQHVESSHSRYERPNTRNEGVAPAVRTREPLEPYGDHLNFADLRRLTCDYSKHQN